MTDKLEPLMPRLVYLEWEDAVDNTSPSWMTRDEVFEWVKNSTWIVREVGFIMKEDSRGIVLASKMEPGNKKWEATFKGISRIPKTWIRVRREIKYLQKGKNEQ